MTATLASIADWVHETTTTTGTGNKTLSAVRRRFSDVFGTGGTNVFEISIHNRDVPTEWQRGYGHMSDANTLVVDTVEESSNSNAAVNFSAGTKDVTCSLPAGVQNKTLRADVTQTFTETQRNKLLANLGLTGLTTAFGLLAIQVADAMNVAQFIGDTNNRVADTFDALTYVNTGGATNLETGTAGLLKNTTSYSRITGSNTPTAPLGGTAANLDDNNTGTTTTASPGNISGAATGSRIAFKIDFGSNKTLTKIEIKQLRDNGSGTNAGKLVYSTDNTNWTQLGADVSENQTPTDYSVTGSVTARYIGYAANAQNWGGLTVTASDLNGYETVTNNVTVTSTTFTADSQPTTAKALFLVKEVDSITLNTDFIAYASRDGGTTYTAFVLTKITTLPGSIAVYQSAELDISGQPSGTSMRWKIVSANNKSFEAHAAYLYWL